MPARGCAQRGAVCYRRKEDLISIGAYQPMPGARRAITLRPRIDAFLRQQVHQPSTSDQRDAELLALAAEPASPAVLTGKTAAPGAHPALAAAPQVPAGGVTPPPRSQSPPCS